MKHTMYRPIAVVILLLTVVLSSPGPASAVERIVPSPSYPTIQDGIDAAVAGDAVVISPGTYTGAGNRDLSLGGKAITVRSTDPADPAVVAATVIDCQGSAGSPHRGFYVRNGEGPDTEIAGLTIVNAYYTGAWPNWGGAIYCNNTDPTIRNCRLYANTASYGGGLCFSDSASTVVDCVIAENGGHGIFASTSDLTVSNCTIYGNVGSGIWNSSSLGSIAVTNCILWGNSNGSETKQIQDSYDNVDPRYSCIQNLLYYADSTLHNTGYDPALVDPDGPDDDPDTWSDNDYHLTDDSPCIDAGDPGGVYGGRTDMDGDPRAMLLRADIGADEYSDAHRSFDPEAYTAGSPVTVTIALPADGAVASVTVEDDPPAGWTVSGIDSGGAWNPGAGRVEWGPFAQGSIPSTVSYDATPPGWESGDRLFTGTAWYDAAPLTVGGRLVHEAVIHNIDLDTYYTTIQWAVDMADPGNVIVVSPGTYTGAGNRDVVLRGKTITVRSTDPQNLAVVASTVIDCQGSVGEFHRGFYVHEGEGPDTMIAGFSITGAYRTGVWPDWGGGIFCYDASPTIWNCRLYGNTATYGGGLCFSESDSLVLGCTTFDNTGMGILYSGSDLTVTNCTIYGNSSRGIWSTSSNNSMILTNSILWGNGTGTESDQLYLTTAGTATPTYCCIEGCSTYCAVPADRNMGDDPLFVDPEAGDFHLQDASPCIDAGTSLAPGLTTTDFDGDARVQGSAVDIGVDEFGSGSPPSLVELIAFTAAGAEGGVTLAWETASEIDNEGFHIRRADDLGGFEFRRITDTLIPAEGGPFGGGAYDYLDDDVLPGYTYRYELEAVDLYGESTFFGPVEGTVPPVCFIGASGL